MKILHINGNYILTSLHQLMTEELTRIGYTNKVYVPTYNKNLSVIKPNDNVVVSECFKKIDRLWFGYKQRKIINDVTAKIDCASYGCIHAYTLFTDGNTAMELSKKYDVPFVVAVRNVDVNVFFEKMIHLRSKGIKIMQKAKAIFFLSEAYRKQVFQKYVPRKYYNTLLKKTHIIPNGIDDFWFENPPTEENKLDKPIKLIYAGRIDRNKNILTTQKAMAILREKGYDVSLTVVGKVADDKVFSEIKVDPYTECLPAQPKEQLLELYRKHNIFVMPSFTESFGLVYAEAMSQGLPVVYSEGQGFDAQFPEGMVGYHVSAHDAQDVADGIEKIINRFSQITPNVISAARSFNWEEITKRYDAIYSAI
ncbi:MAG: glycosyltransferase family 4 protein [Ruminococcaceae bacterium]|nr:glycosyltransferase family 4 protein [Oscillospiraceae bacterium]